MGWTGGDDTLNQVELIFPSAEEAIAYARRQSLTFVVHGVQQPERHCQPPLRPRQSQDCGTAVSGGYEQMKGDVQTSAVRTAVGSALEPSKPVTQYAHPDDVLRDATLSAREKHDILNHWALEACRRQTSNGASGKAA
jgi:hypothetical protein